MSAQDPGERMYHTDRMDNYLRQTGRRTLTPRQSRRHRKNLSRAYAPLEEGTTPRKDAISQKRARRRAKELFRTARR